MLESKMVLEIIAFLLVNGGLSVLLERIPLFQTLPPWARDWFFKGLAFIAPAIIAALQMAAPEVLNQTPLALLLAGAAYLVTQIVHEIDKRLAARAS